MRKLMTFILLTVIISSCGQTALEYFDNGIEKQNKQNFKGALSDYSKAIELEEAFIEAYYNRALVYLNLEKHKEAMSDLDKVIEINERFPNALITRGLIYVILEDKEACCRDFLKAKEIGDTAANRLLAQYCENKKQTKESFVLHWPEDKNWNIAGNQENNEMIFVELLRNDETFDNWSEIGTMQTIKGMVNIPLDELMNNLYENAKQNCPKAVLTPIEKGENEEFPWIIFTIECDFYNNIKAAESHFYYLVQGNESLYINFIGVKTEKILNDKKKEWIDFFKSGKIVNVNKKK